MTGRSGARLAIIMIPAPFQTSQDRWDKWVKWMGPQQMLHDLHWTIEGHRLAAETVSAFLTE